LLCVAFRALRFIACSPKKCTETAKVPEHRSSRFVVGPGNEEHCEEKSMTNRFLISVAAVALIAGTGFANAQGAGGASREGAGSTVQQSAPPSGGGAAQQAPQHRESQQPGMKSGQSEKAPGAGKEAQDMKGGKDKGTVGQAPDKSGATTQREDKMGRDKDKSGTVGQAPEKGGAATKGHDEKMGQDKMGQGREDKMGQPGQKGSTDTNRAQQNQGTTDTNRAQTNQPGGAQTTTGAVTSARVAAPPPEKQTQIVSAIKSERIQETTNVNVNVSVGTVLPASVHFVPLPPRIVEIYPEWRGFEVVLIHGRYVIVRPQTREIVYIIEG
jgi:hypothetical protein